MALGTAFPVAFLQAHVASKLLPGTVIKLMARMDDGKVHEKRFVVVHVSDVTLTCVINTDPSEFVKSRPALASCQVMVDAASHPFMDYDSWLDCVKTFQFVTRAVVSDLCEKPEWILGNIQTPLQNAMLAGIASSKAMSVVEKQKIRESFGLT